MCALFLCAVCAFHKWDNHIVFGLFGGHDGLLLHLALLESSHASVVSMLPSTFGLMSQHIYILSQPISAP